MCLEIFNPLSKIWANNAVVTFGLFFFPLINKKKKKKKIEVAL